MIEIKITIEYSETDECFIARLNDSLLATHGDTAEEALIEMCDLFHALYADGGLKELLEANQV